MKPTLIVMAAGMGSRYGRLKQLDPFGPAGETIIEYSVYDAIRAGFGKVVFVIRKSLEATFAEEIFAKLAGHIAVEYVFQELEYLPEGFSVPEGRVKPWGTGQAVLLAGAKVDEPFAVINGDDFYGPESFGILAGFLSRCTDPAATDYAVVGYRLRNTCRTLVRWPGLSAKWTPTAGCGACGNSPALGEPPRHRVPRRTGR
jgi:UTP-glucose-1-phosphate uridylyltransferase